MQYKILSDPKVIVTSAQGVLTVSEILSKFKLMSQDPLFDADTHYLHDFRAVTELAGSVSDHERMAEFAVSIASSEPLNVVFVIPEPICLKLKYHQ